MLRRLPQIKPAKINLSLFGRLGEGLALELDELGDTLVAQVEQGVETLAVEGRLLAGTLELDHLTGIGGDEVHVDLGVAVLGIIEVEQGVAVDNAHGNGGNLAR